MANPRTAKHGKADWSLNGVSFVNLPHTRKIDWNPKTELKEYVSSDTDGAKRRLEGTDDFDGSVEVYIDPTNRFDADSFGIRSGVAGFLRVYEHRTDVPFLLPIMVENVEYSVDIEGGEIVGATVNFSADGAVTYPD